MAVNRYEHGDQFHLAVELAQGHKVIVGVDSGKLWGENPILAAIEDTLGIRGADHAVVVSGIDTGDPQHVQVLVSDPGTGQAVASYPLEQFLDAWHGSDFFMVATQAPSPPHLPEMVHFDYGLGHLPEVANLPDDQFLEFADRPDAWGQMVHHYVEVHHDVDVYHDFEDGSLMDHHADDPADQGLPDDHLHPPTDHHELDLTRGLEHGAGHAVDDPTAGLSDADAGHDFLTDYHHPDTTHQQLDTAEHFPDGHLPNDPA